MLKLNEMLHTIIKIQIEQLSTAAYRLARGKNYVVRTTPSGIRIFLGVQILKMFFKIISNRQTSAFIELRVLI